MMVQMLGVFAEFERATIIDRVIAGMERKAARGEWCGGARPYGYLVDQATGHLIVNPDEAPLVPVIFDRYGRRRHGAKTIATWLNKHGHRTKAGKPWNHMAVLTVLRNRVYLGEVFFRDTYHQAPHAPLIDFETFDLAQQILRLRGEEYSHRASNSSDYLLAGLITCTHCGKRYIGTASHGNKYRYRYYTCFSRQRYGTATCPAERLPADQLESEIRGSLLRTIRRHDLLDAALAAGLARSGAERRQHQDELKVVEAELTKAEEAIERYFLAFEAGTMSETTCAQRVQTLGGKIATLQARQRELASLLEAEREPTVTQAHLDRLRSHVVDTIEHGDPEAQKGLLQALVARIEVESRASVRPYFRVPLDGGGLTEPNPSDNGKVRPPSGSAPPAGAGPVLRRVGAAGSTASACPYRNRLNVQVTAISTPAKGNGRSRDRGRLSPPSYPRLTCSGAGHPSSRRRGPSRKRRHPRRRPPPSSPCRVGVAVMPTIGAFRCWPAWGAA